MKNFTSRTTTQATAVKAECPWKKLERMIKENNKIVAYNQIILASELKGRVAVVR